MKLPNKLTALSIVTVLGVVGGGSALVLPSNTEAEDVPPIVKQVEDQGKKLDEHETRITSTENAVSGLQSGSTTVITERVNSPVSQSTATPAPAPSPAPVTVASHRQIPIEGSDNIDCEVTYSDGTVERWPWKVVNPQGAWMVDEATQQGKWVATTQTSGTCN